MNYFVILIAIVLIFLAFLYSDSYDNRKEGFSNTDSDEAIQNLASIYNKQRMIVDTLEATNSIKSPTITSLETRMNDRMNNLNTAINNLNGQITTVMGEINKIKADLANYKNTLKTKNIGINFPLPHVNQKNYAHKCPIGSYMIGINHGKKWDWKFPICAQFPG